MILYSATWLPQLCVLALLTIAYTQTASRRGGGDSDGDIYNIQQNDGSYQFGYDAPDSYHHSKADRANRVVGQFGSRNPKTGGTDRVAYTAGPRGYRPRGDNIHRKFDQNQNGPRAVGSRDDPYFDPSEDPSYNFAFNTRTYSRTENADRRGDVTGKYTYIDDVGERHNVEFVAGKDTGFHVKTPFPDSNPRAYGPLFFNGRGKPIPRGRTSIQRGLDGSYRFVSSGPDQRRTETSDAQGNTRGSYTYLDDKGVQHSVHYIAGPNIGYRVLKNVKGPHLPGILPFADHNIVPSDFYDYVGDPITGEDVFPAFGQKPNRGGSSAGRPRPSGSRPGIVISTTPSSIGGDFPSSTATPSFPDGDDFGDGDLDKDLFGGESDGAGGGGGSISTGLNKPSTSGSDFGRPNRPSGGRPGGFRPTAPSRPVGGTASDEDDDDDLGSDTLFGSSPSQRPSIQIGIHKPPGGGSGSGGGPSHTVVTNLGDTFFTIPPGVSVRAHVHTIDLYPYESKIPSPSDQFRAEMSQLEQKITSASEQVAVTAAIDKGATEAVTTAPTTVVTTAKATSTSTSSKAGTSTTVTTKSAPKPTRKLTTTTAATRDEDDDDVKFDDIF